MCDWEMKVTLTLIILCILFTFYAWGSNPSWVQGKLIYSFQNLVNGKPWTLLTSLFIHVDWFHLLGNIFFLFIFGGSVEEDLGSSETILTFLIGGLSSLLLSPFFYGPEALVTGASASIFSLMSLSMLVNPLKFIWPLFSPLGVISFFFFLYNLFSIYMGFQSNTAYYLHITGFIVGFILGVKWSPKWKRNFVISTLLFILYSFLVSLISGYLGLIVLG